MANNEQTLRIEEINGIEPIPSWGSLCKTPQTLLTEIAKRLVAVGTLQDTNLIISDKVPTSKERRKIWIKTSWPYGIGYVIEGSYQMDYGMTGLPVNIPFLHTEFQNTLGFVRILSSSELEGYGIADTNTSAPNRMRWYIFQPPQIKY